MSGIPVDNATTAGAAPPLHLLLNPRLDTDLLLAPDVIQDLAMVTKAIVIEIDDLLTGKISALCAVGQPFTESAFTQVTFAAHDSSYV
jgi:hypothetical protein